MLESNAGEQAQTSRGSTRWIGRVLVPLDGSSVAARVLPHAQTLVRSFEADLVLLRVVGNGTSGGRHEGLDAAGWRLERLEAERYLEDLASELQKKGIHADIRTAVGSAAEQILTTARAESIDLILLSTHGESGYTEFRLGGTAAKTIAAAECSVLLVPSREEPLAAGEPAVYSRIVVPVDGSKRSGWAAMQAACIARQSGAELLLVHVIRHPEVVGESGAESELRRAADRLVELNTAAAYAYLEREQRALESPNLSVRYRLDGDDNIPQVISRVVEEEEGSLVVVSAHGRSPATGWPYGTVVGSLLAYGSRPILVLQDLPQRRASRAHSATAARPRSVAEPAA